MSSSSRPSASATTCAIVVSMPWPCAPVPSATVTLPVGCTRTTAVSVPIGSIIPVLGSTYRPMPMPSSRPSAANARACSRTELVVPDDLGRLLERLGRAHVIERECRSAGCTAARSAARRCGAATRGDRCRARARRCRPAVRGRPSRTPTAPVRATRRTCSSRPSASASTPRSHRYGPVNKMPTSAPAPPVAPIGNAPASSMWST